MTFRVGPIVSWKSWKWRRRGKKSLFTHSVFSDFWVTFCPFSHFWVTFLSLCQDAFDHDKGQKSANFGGRCCGPGKALHWRLSTGFFAFSPVFMCNLVRRVPLKSGESSEKSSGENRVKSCHVLWLSWFFRRLTLGLIRKVFKFCSL